METLSICIVNWNSGSQLRDCIASIGRAKRERFVLSEVIITDNGSSDESLNHIESLGLPVKIIRNDHNVGFAIACNQGAAAGSGNFILFLNPDTRLHERSLADPIAYMSRPENAHVAICGIQMVDEAGRECLSYARFPALGRFALQAIGISRSGRGIQEQVSWAGNSPSSIEVDQVIGAFFLTRRSVFDSLHGFDERFFVYYEEVDYSLRTRKAGSTSVCLKDVTCMHAGGGSSKQVKSERLFYSLRSRLLYGGKHFSRPSAFVLLLITMVLEFPSRLFYALVRSSGQDVLHTIRGYAMLIRDLPAIVRTALRARD